MLYFIAPLTTVWMCVKIALILYKSNLSWIVLGKVAS